MSGPKKFRADGKIAEIIALDAMNRLSKLLCGRSGQSYKLRSLLYSLWNGKPAQLHEVFGLDWDLRQDFCSVLMAFGFEGENVELFYVGIEKSVRAVGQWEWFLEERLEYRTLERYAKISKAAAEKEAK